MNPLLGNLAEADKGTIKKCPQPEWMEPMLATLTEGRFPDEGWIFERKFDGERCLVFRKGNVVRLRSRNRTVLNDTYPELEAAFLDQDTDNFIADGEIVAFEKGIPRFSRLQGRMQITDRVRARRSEIEIIFHLFDLMYLDGYDIAGVMLRTRKSILKNALRFEDPIRFTAHCEGDGRVHFREACNKGWEGLIAKRASGRYVHHRSTDWLKLRCVRRQEFVIGGYTDPGGSRVGFGALMLGYYDGESLIYAGKVGTGFDNRVLEDIAGRLSSRKQSTSPYSDKKRREKGEHWVVPDLVCEVAFTEWTVAGRLRHPRFLGIRPDKNAREVVREIPE